eukprot:PhF_6_TR28846/c0_g2_i1/m.42201
MVDVVSSEYFPIAAAANTANDRVCSQDYSHGILLLDFEYSQFHFRKSTTTTFSLRKLGKALQMIQRNARRSWDEYFTFVRGRGGELVKSSANKVVVPNYQRCLARSKVRSISTSPTD